MNTTAPNMAPSDAQLCPKCRAELHAGVMRCWLCEAEVQQVAADTAAAPHAASQAVPAERVGSYSLASLLMFITLVSVVLGVSTIALGIGIPLGVVLLVAWLRTAAVLHHRPIHGRTTSPVEKLQLFVESFGFTLALIALTGIVAGAAVVAGFFACMGTWAVTDQEVLANIVWWVVGLAIGIPAFWWLGKRMAKVIRRRWQRDVGESQQSAHHLDVVDGIGDRSGDNTRESQQVSRSSSPLKARSLWLVVGCGGLLAALLGAWAIYREQSRSGVMIYGHSTAAFSADGKWLATLNIMGSYPGDPGERLSSTVRICDASNGGELRTLAKSGEYFCDLHCPTGGGPLITLSTNSRLAGPGTLRLTRWDTETWRELDSVVLDKEYYLATGSRFALSPDGRRFYEVRHLSNWARQKMPAERQFPGWVKCWQLRSGEELFTIDEVRQPGIQLSELIFSPDGTRMAAPCGSGLVKVWDAATGSELYSRSQLTPRRLAFSQDGQLLAVVGGEGRSVRLWSLRRGQEADAVTAHPLTYSPWLVAVSPDSRQLAVSDAKQNVDVLDVVSGQVVHSTQIPAKGTVISWLGFSPDGKRLAAAGGIDEEYGLGGMGTRRWNDIHVWDTRNGKLLVNRSREGLGGVNCVVFSPDGRRLLAVGRETVILYRLPPAQP